MPPKKPVRKVRAKTAKQAASIRMTEEEVIAAYYRAHPYLKPPEPQPEPQKQQAKKPQKPNPQLQQSSGSWPLSKVIGAVFTSVMAGLSIALLILLFVR